MNACIEARAQQKNAETNAQLAENDKVKAAAQKLSAEFQTGEFVNWKTGVDTAISALQIIIGAIGAAKGTSVLPITKN